MANRCGGRNSFKTQLKCSLFWSIQALARSHAGCANLVVAGLCSTQPVCRIVLPRGRIPVLGNVPYIWIAYLLAVPRHDFYLRLCGTPVVCANMEASTHPIAKHMDRHVVSILRTCLVACARHPLYVCLHQRNEYSHMRQEINWALETSWPPGGPSLFKASNLQTMRPAFTFIHPSTDSFM